MQIKVFHKHSIVPFALTGTGWTIIVHLNIIWSTAVTKSGTGTWGLRRKGWDVESGFGD